MNGTQQIDFYFDFTSPYAYIAALQIDGLVNKYGYCVRWNPFLIGAALSITGRKPSLGIPLVDSYVLNDIQRTAREFNIECTQPKKFPILGVKPGRLFCFLSDQELGQVKAKAFAIRAFEQYFVHGEDISDIKVLQSIVTEFGINNDQAAEIIASLAMKQRFRNEVNQALERKIFAAPMFDVAGELFWGVDHLPQLERWLKTGGW